MQGWRLPRLLSQSTTPKPKFSSSANRLWKSSPQSAADDVSSDGSVYDIDRIMYLRNYLAQLQRATSEGVPVRGYFLWSLMDNFEWIYGFEKRFGLYRVDFETQLRTPKLSVSFYRNVIERNAVGF
jgi:beta-glucosidase